MKTSTKEAVDTYINGNKEDFKAWLKRAHKIDILDAIEYACGWHGIGRHSFINTMRAYLVNKYRIL